MPLSMLFIFSCLLEGTSSSQSSQDENKEKKDLYRGTIVDVQGNTYELEHITVAGKDIGIAFYKKPQENNKDIDPGKAYELLNLKDIAKMRAVDPGQLLTFKQVGRPDTGKPVYETYVEFAISFRGKSEEEMYIIQSKRELIGKKSGRSSSVHIQLAALKSLAIHAGAHSDCDSAKELLTILESENNNPDLQEKSRSGITRMTHKLKDWISSWCS